MKFKILFKSTSAYIFEEAATGNFYFVGVFGHLGVITRSFRLTDDERSKFLNRGADFANDLWTQVEARIGDFMSRFDHVDSDPGIIDVIKANSFASGKTSVLKKLLSAFK